MSNATISVVRIENGIVKDVAHYDYTELESALMNFRFHVETDARYILDKNTHITQDNIDHFCGELYADSDGYPSVFWNDNNSIQMILDI